MSVNHDGVLVYPRGACYSGQNGRRRDCRTSPRPAWLYSKLYGPPRSVSTADVAAAGPRAGRNEDSGITASHPDRSDTEATCTVTPAELVKNMVRITANADGYTRGSGMCLSVGFGIVDHRADLHGGQIIRSATGAGADAERGDEVGARPHK